jgi:uncharacterized protein YegP (UPF0339 family)
MEFKLSDARVRELGQIEAEAGAEIHAGAGWDQELAHSVVNGVPPSGSTTIQFVIYQDDAEQYRWKCTAQNGTTIAQSTRGYPDPTECENEIRWLQSATPTAPILT